MNGLSMLLGMGGGLDQGNNDLMTMMLFQQLTKNGDSDISDDKILQKLLFAPLGKKFLTKLARKIQQIAEAEGKPVALTVAELLAAQIIRDLEEEQEGDLKQIFKAARTFVQMKMVGGSGIESGGINYLPEEERPQALSGAIGGYVKGKLAEKQTPVEELEEVMREDKKEEKITAKSKKTAKSLRGLI